MKKLICAALAVLITAICAPAVGQVMRGYSFDTAGDPKGIKPLKCWDDGSERYCELMTPDLFKTVIDDCDAITGWTGLSNDTAGIAVDLDHVLGSNSLEFDKVNGTGNLKFGAVQKVLSSVDLSDHVKDGGYIFYPINLSALTDIDYCFIRLGASSSHYNEWRVADTDMTTGWQLLAFPIQEPSTAGNTGNGWDESDVDYVVVGCHFDAETDALADLRVDNIFILSGMQEGSEIISLLTASVALLTLIEVDTSAMVVDLAALEVLATSIDADTAAMVVDLAAIEVDMAAIEVLLTSIDADTAAMVTDLAAIEVLQTTIAGDTTSIDADTTAMVTDLAAIEVLQTTIAGDTTSIDADTTTIAADTTSIDADTTTIAADTTSIDADTTTIAADTTSLDGKVTTTDADTGAGTDDTQAVVTVLPGAGGLVQPSVGAGNVDTGTPKVTIATDDVNLAAMVVDLAALEVLATSIDADTAAMVVDLAAIEVLQTAIAADTAAMVVDLAAIEVLQISIDADTTTIAADTTSIDADTTAMVTDLAAIEVLQTSIEGDTTAIQAAVEIIDDWDNGEDRANVIMDVHYDLDSMDATTGWASANDAGTGLALIDNHIEGTGSLQLDKVDGAGFTEAYIEKTLSSVDMIGVEMHGAVEWAVYMSDLTDVAYAFIRLGDDNTNYSEWRVDDTELTAGIWNPIAMTVGSAEYANVGTGVDLSDVDYVAVGVSFDLEDDLLNDLAFDGLHVHTSAHTTATITSEVSSSVSSANVNVLKMGSQVVNMNSGTAGNGTQRVTNATDDIFSVSDDNAANTLANPMYFQISQDGTNAVDATHPLPISDDLAANTEGNPIYTEVTSPVLDADDVAACLAIPAAEADYTVTHDQTQICASGNTVYILCANAAPVTADHTVGNFSIVVPDGMCLGPYDFTGLTVCSYIGVAAAGFVCFLGSDYK